MGYQLIEVSKRKNVERITVAEIDKSLIDWLMPVIREKLGPVPVDVIHGDVFKVFGPPFEADVCLLDVYPKMGSNTAGPLSGNPGLKKIWVWGAERKERGRAFISSRAV
jgi:spermidine synthase